MCMPVLVKQSAFRDSVAYVKNFFNKLMYPNNTLVQTAPVSNVMIYSMDGVTRSRYASYPIFSLHESDGALLAEFRDILRSNNVEWKEIPLPGPNEPEIGFVVSRKDIEMLMDTLPEPLDKGVKAQFYAWNSVPWLTLFPEGVTVPDECYLQFRENFQAYAIRGRNNQKNAEFILLNVPTGAQARVHINFVKKTYSINRDTTGWVHVARLPLPL